MSPTITPAAIPALLAPLDDDFPVDEGVWVTKKKTVCPFIIVTTGVVVDAVLEGETLVVPEGFVPSSLMLGMVPWRLSATRYTDVYFEPPPHMF